MVNLEGCGHDLLYVTLLKQGETVIQQKFSQEDGNPADIQAVCLLNTNPQNTHTKLHGICIFISG